MAKYIVTVVSRESQHFSVEADSKDQAVDRARDFWGNGSDSKLGEVMGVHEVSLGSEFAEIEDAYVDEAESD